MKRFPFYRLLIAYYGLIQAAHIVAITRSYTLFIQHEEITFLAQPPPGSWSAQAQHFLVSLGAIDFVTAFLALIFVYGYFSQKRWWFWLGTSTLTVSVISALIYGYGTIASGAWSSHLVDYLIMVVLFVPVTVLFVLFGIWGVKGMESENPE